MIPRPPEGAATPLVGVYSRGLMRIPHLELFLQPWGRPVDAWSKVRGELAAIAGWGYRPTARRAREAAARSGLPYLAMEDGFLRSVGLGVRGAPPWSLVVDGEGIFYDAGAPSRLERLIQQGDDGGAAGAALLAAVRRTGLSKYNVGAAPAPESGGAPLVYVLDQTFGDVSIRAGGADPSSFEAMLDAAIAENPGCRVVVRVHPVVIAGRRRGHLAPLAMRRGVALDASGGDWASLAAAAARVYTVSSLGGFEALVAGAPVTCFGTPFYAGWGLTDDRRACPPRRGVARSLEQVFHAAYGLYPQYVDPVMARRCDALTVVRRLSAARMRPPLPGPLVVAGVQRWKRPLLRPHLAREATAVRFAESSAAALRIAERTGGALAVWATREPAGLAQAASRTARPVLRMEDGFLRSAGLGSDFRAALSIVVDDIGIYSDARRESRLERLLWEGGFAPELLKRAAAFRERFVASRVSKYNLGLASAAARRGDGRRTVLVLGQVETDAAVRWSSPEVSTNLELLRLAREASPDARLLFKPHPEVESGHRRGAVAGSKVERYADAVLRACAPAAALDLADEVHAMTSLLGFEALLRGLKVVTYGLPFYAGLGLTQDRMTWPRPRRPRSLDELTAAAFLLYPRYLDPGSGLPIEAEEALEILARTLPLKPDGLLAARRLLRWLSLTWEG